jgi:hypothetical protein
MPGLDISLNNQSYVLSPREDGSKVATSPVQQFVQPMRLTGRTRPEDIAPYESFIFPNLAYGFGRARINSDVAFDPKEYRRFFDSTCDTRWMDSIYLSIQSEVSTKTSGDEVVRSSVSFKGEHNSLWEATSSKDVVNRQYTGGSTTWENGGTVDDHRDATSNGTGTNVTGLTVSHTCTGVQRLLVVGVTVQDGSIADPDTVTYGGVGMTKAGEVTNGDVNASIWYLKAPALSANDIVVAMPMTANAIHIGAQSFTGVYQDTPVGTVATASGSGTAQTVSPTTTVNGYVLDAVVVQDNVTLTVGSGQTQISQNTGGGSHKGAISVERPSSTSTAMAWSTAATETWAIAALPVNINVSVAMDIVQHKGNLVALIVSDVDHLVYTSTDGATWTAATTQITAGLMVDGVTANEDIDAGLMATIGGELCAAIWDEDSGTITFFSSINAGVAWTDENMEIASSNGPIGLAVYPDIDGTNKLYLSTQDGIYIIDTSPTLWTSDLIFPMPGIVDTDNRNHNGRGMAVHQGALWFAQGVDDDSPAPVYRLTVQGDSRLIESGYGLSYGDGVPENLHGSILSMISAGDFLFASVGGGKASRFSRLVCWNSFGWHSMTKNASANQPIEWIDLGTGDDGNPRLHYGIRTGPSVATAHFLGNPLVNPRSGATINRDDFSQASTTIQNDGHIELPKLDFGLPAESKMFSAVHINADSLTDTSNEYIEVEYGLDGDATTTDLGNFTSSTTKVTFASGVGVSAKNIGLRLKLNRADGTVTNTPKLKDIVVEGYVVPSIAYQHQMTIDIEATALATGQPVETIITNLQTLISTVTLVSLSFGKVTDKVAVDRDRTGFSFSIKSEENSGAPNALAHRTGYLTLVLIEKLAS